MFYIVTKSGLTISFPGQKTFNVAKDHPNFDQVLEAVKNNEPIEKIEPLVELKAQIAKLSAEGVTITADDDDQLKVEIDQKEVSILSPELQYRLIAMLREEDSDLKNETYKAFAKFLKNLYQNPSYKSVEQLYGFLESNDLPITQNGTFLAYKKVEADYFDIHSHSFDNSIGKTVSMPRYQVEDNPEVTCSHGLHVCSYGYLDNYASSDLNRVVICEVNPKDVVSIPTDYNNAKMRVCEYKVVDEIPTFFDAQLSSYVYGNHEDGWMTKAFDKLVNLYKTFFQIDNVQFSENPDNVIATPVVVEDFFKAAKAAQIDVPAKLIEKCTEHEVIPTMKELFQWLSKYDENWVRVEGSNVPRDFANTIVDENDEDDYYDSDDEDDDYDDSDDEDED